MIRNSLAIVIIVALTIAAGGWLLGRDALRHDHDHASGHGHGEHAAPGHAEEDYPRGAHGGRLLEQGDFALEITIFETGIPPEFRVYAYQGGQPLAPAQVALSITLSRLGGDQDKFSFKAAGDYLRGAGVVTEPHSFDVGVEARYGGETYAWSYASHEGRTRIPAALARLSGIRTATAGPGAIRSYLPVNGRLRIDPNRQSRVRAPYPGIVRASLRQLGETVKQGERLLTVQNTQSLQNYTVRAPISGVITERRVQAGESTAGEVLYQITDLSELWVELDVFSRDAGRVRPGQAVELKTLGGEPVSGQIAELWPIASAGSQSVRAIVRVRNEAARLRPGEAVRGRIIIGERAVELAVARDALQTFRDFDVVFARFGEQYEVRMLELGEADADWIEVTGGLKPGAEYVLENSYLIKADIEKSGASHDH